VITAPTEKMEQNAVPAFFAADTKTILLSIEVLVTEVLLLSVLDMVDTSSGDVGRGVGTNEGKAVGTKVGVTVGVAVGLTVGTAVGTGVGILVGIDVGCRDGCPDG
jgi:hypothetical protein